MTNPIPPYGPGGYSPAGTEQPGTAQPRMVPVERPVTKPTVTYTILAITVFVYLLQELTRMGIAREPFLALSQMIFGPEVLQALLQNGWGDSLLTLLGGKINAADHRGAVLAAAYPGPAARFADAYWFQYVRAVCHWVHPGVVLRTPALPDAVYRRRFGRECAFISDAPGGFPWAHPPRFLGWSPRRVSLSTRTAPFLARRRGGC